MASQSIAILTEISLLLANGKVEVYFGDQEEPTTEISINDLAYEMLDMFTVPVTVPVEDRYVRADDDAARVEIIATAQALENAAKKLRDAVEKGELNG